MRVCGYVGNVRGMVETNIGTDPVDSERVAQAVARLPSAEEVGRLSGVLSLMADPTRARLLYALDVVDELCVGDLALALGVSED